MIAQLMHHGVAIVDEELKAEAVFNHFDQILGAVEACSQGIDMDRIGLSRGQVPAMDHCFSDDEVWSIIMDIQSLAPSLCLAMRAKMQATRLVRDALHDDVWIRDIEGALNMVVLEQYVLLWHHLQNV
jgi:hypothetical protein